MLASWTIESHGQTYEVTVSRAENGKDVIRVNGRVAARPLDDSEFERTIVLGQRHFNVTRESDGQYTLTPLGSGIDASLALSNVAGASSEDSRRENNPSLRVAPILFAVMFVVIAGGLFWSMSLASYRKTAEKRINALLTVMKQGPGPSDESAAALWMNASTQLDRDDLPWALRNFDAWRKEKNLARKFGLYRIVDSEEIKGTVFTTAVVHVSIEGNEYKIRVPRSHPLSWE